MGIYYYAIDHNEKKYFDAPDDYAIKTPGIYHPNNPFPGMVIMMNCRGYNFEIENDCSNSYGDGTYQDITEKVFSEYRKEFVEYFAEKEKKE
jgi:hypothetical protein